MISNTVRAEPVEARRWCRLAAVVLALLAAGRAAALDVVATTEGLAALTRELAGDRASVQSLSRGTQDPHFVDANPNLAVKLRKAGLLVDLGLDLEAGWLPGLVNVSRNAAIQPGGPRRFTAASAVQVLEAATGPVDRGQGDLHPAGNPHFLSDPRRVLPLARALSAKLGEVDPGGRAAYAQRLADFERRLGEARARWEARLAPARGKPVVTHHRTLSYFADWAGLDVVGYLEPKPGTAPPPSHVAALVQLARSRGVKAVVVENYYDPRAAELLAKSAGAQAVVIPGDVGGVPEAKDWFGWIDALVERIGGAAAR